MKNIFDLVIRFMAISAMLVGVSLAMVATAPESVAAESSVSELVAVESESVSEMTKLPMVNTYAQSDDGYDPKILYKAVVEAVARHDYDRLQQLINAGADLNFRPGDDFPKLSHLTEEEQLAKRHIFWAVFPDKYYLSGERTQKRAYKMVKFLLDAGAKIEGPHGKDNGVVHHAMLGSDVNLIKLAVAHGAVVKDYTNPLWPLHGGNYLFSARSPEMLKYLLDLGLDLHLKNKYGGSPLHRIVPCRSHLRDCHEMVRILLAHGADPHLKDVNGESPMSRAKKALNFEMVKLLNSAKPGSRSDSKAETPAKDKSDNGDKSEDKVASPKKSESKVPSYGTAGDCADFMQDTPPDISRAILNILKRHKVSCYTVPDQCEDLLKGESPDIRKKLKVALGTLRIYCYQ